MVWEAKTLRKTENMVRSVGMTSSHDWETIFDGWEVKFSAFNIFPCSLNEVFEEYPPMAGFHHSKLVNLHLIGMSLFDTSKQ